MDPVKVCPTCGVENDPSFSFCRQCGTPLTNATANPQPPIAPPPMYGQPPVAPPPVYGQPPIAPPPMYGQPPVAPPPMYGQPVYAYPPVAPPPVYPVSEIDGIPAAAIADFVGPKAPYFIRKFALLDRNNSKASFNAAVFFLTLFFGPIVGCLWFFRRRLNNIGLIVGAVGVVTTVIRFVTILIAVGRMADVYNQMANNLGQGLLPQMNFTSFYNPTLSILDGILSAISIAAAIVLGIFANGWYKDHVVSKLKAMQGEPDGITPQKVRAQGGIRSGIWVTILVVLIAASLVISCIGTVEITPAVINFVQQSMQGMYGYGNNYNYYGF